MIFFLREKYKNFAGIVKTAQKREQDNHSMKCPFSELFWSVFSRIWTVRMRENTQQDNSEYGHFLRSGWFL